MEETAQFLYYQAIEALLKKDFDTAEVFLERARRKPGFSHEAEIAYTALQVRKEAMKQKEVYKV
jgi:outer membrane protein assembly factor BamD (BamD/ComL family)